MELISTAEFLAWAAARGIGRSRDYPHSESLTYPGAEGTWDRFRREPLAEPVHDFVHRAVTVAAAGAALWVYPPRRGGAWDLQLDEMWPMQALRLIQRGAGVPANYVGAIRFAPEELVSASLLLTAAVQYAGCLWEVCVVPDHARCVLQSDEDGDLIGNFPSEASRASYDAALRQAGWVEPSGLDPRVSETDPWLER